MNSTIKKSSHKVNLKLICRRDYFNCFLILCFLVPFLIGFAFLNGVALNNFLFNVSYILHSPPFLHILKITCFAYTLQLSVYCIDGIVIIPLRITSPCFSNLRFPICTYQLLLYNLLVEIERCKVTSLVSLQNQIFSWLSKLWNKTIWLLSSMRTCAHMIYSSFTLPKLAREVYAHIHIT